MTYEELLGWLNYFERRPLGWQEDLRTGYLMNSLGDKRNPKDIFPSIKAVSSNQNKSLPDKLKGSAMLQKLLLARDGHKIPLGDSSDKA